MMAPDRSPTVRRRIYEVLAVMFVMLLVVTYFNIRTSLKTRQQGLCVRETIQVLNDRTKYNNLIGDVDQRMAELNLQLVQGTIKIDDYRTQAARQVNERERLTTERNKKKYPRLDECD